MENCQALQYQEERTSIFSIVINVDLAHGIKRISIDNIQVAILLYADDIILLADNEVDLKKMLEKLNVWCRKGHISLF